MQTLDLLVKKENVLLKKASMEQEKAKDFSKAKNKRGMFQILGFEHGSHYFFYILYINSANRASWFDLNN